MEIVRELGKDLSLSTLHSITSRGNKIAVKFDEDVALGHLGSFTSYEDSKFKQENFESFEGFEVKPGLEIRDDKVVFFEADSCYVMVDTVGFDAGSGYANILSFCPFIGVNSKYCATRHVDSYIKSVISVAEVKLDDEDVSAWGNVDDSVIDFAELSNEVCMINELLSSGSLKIKGNRGCLVKEFEVKEVENKHFVGGLRYELSWIDKRGIKTQVCLAGKDFVKGVLTGIAFRV